MSTHDSPPPSDSGSPEGPESESPPTRRASDDGTTPTHGARLLLDGSGAAFRVWAPDRAAVEVVMVDRSEPPVPGRRWKLARQPDGYHVGNVTGARAGDRYFLSPDGERLLPDPASRFQPLGVHGPSELVDLRAFTWTDARWRGCPLEDLVIYEVHVGAATAEGTFRALIARLDHIRALGATAIELMPIADFPGDRNWGYDGVCLFAPARCYGRPEDLAALVDAAHARGLAVLLDVVYNHLGPDGNYLRAWTDQWFDAERPTPWGPALRFDAEPVRTFLRENAAQWIRELHFDGLRLDATHAIHDSSEHPSEHPRPTRAPHEAHVLTAIADAARAAASEREVLVIAEDERNEARIVRDAARGGLGLDAVWADDFHHELRRLLAGDHEGHFGDFQGTVAELARILQRGWLYEGQVAASFGRPRGSPALELPPPRLVFCVQNHDQVGNRALGDRLHHGRSLAEVRAAVVLLLSLPYTPLLFMGQELASSSPFQYFTAHHDGLGRLVTEGRRAEFARFAAFGDPAGVPDPQARETFLRSKIDWSEAERSPGREMLALHQDLLRLRREEPPMASTSRADFDVGVLAHDLLAVRRRPRRLGTPLLFLVGLKGGGTVELDALEVTKAPAGHDWHVELDTGSPRYGGEAPAHLQGSTLALGGPSAVVLRARPRP